MSDDLADTLKSHYRDWFAALTRPGTGPLEFLLAEDWRYTNYDGLFRGRDEYLDWVSGLQEPLTFVGPYDVEVHRHGEIALVFGGYRVLHEPDPRPLELRFTGVWIQNDHRWQCLLHHNSELTG
jgi:ketosteroid isomerase-like protein